MEREIGDCTDRHVMMHFNDFLQIRSLRWMEIFHHIIVYRSIVYEMSESFKWGNSYDSMYGFFVQIPVIQQRPLPHMRMNFFSVVSCEQFWTHFWTIAPYGIAL